MGVKKYIFGRGIAKANTFIGGVSATINTPALIASKLGLSESRIKAFKVVGSDIEFAVVGGSYFMRQDTFKDSASLTYFDDRGGLYTTMDRHPFRGSTNIRYLNFKGLINCANLSFSDIIGNNLEYIYIPNCTFLGTTNQEDFVFRPINSGVRLYVHPSLATNNLGGPDGDIVYAISKGAIVRYVTDFTAPSPITDLSSATIYNTAIQLNFAVPSGANAIDYYECYANGVKKNNITASGQYIIGLTEITSYTITLIAVDVFYNKSVVSNSLVVSTNTTSAVPTSGLVSYYKLNSNSNDSYGSNNGVDTSVSYVAGKIGNSALFNATSNRIDIADNNDFSFTNGGGVDVPFSISMWVKFSAFSATGNWLINKRNATSGGDEWQLAYFSGKLNFYKFDKASNSIYQQLESSTGLIALNNWYHLVFTDDGSKTTAGMKLYLNGSLLTTTPLSSGIYTGMNNGTAITRIGGSGWSTSDSVFHKGNIDELAIYKNKALDATEVALLYNSGNGITL